MVENTSQIYVATLRDIQQHHQKSPHGSVSVTVTKKSLSSQINFIYPSIHFFPYPFQRFLLITYNVPGSGPAILRETINRAVLALLELEIEE